MLTASLASIGGKNLDMARTNTACVRKGGGTTQGQWDCIHITTVCSDAIPKMSPDDHRTRVLTRSSTWGSESRFLNRMTFKTIYPNASTHLPTATHSVYRIASHLRVSSAFGPGENRINSATYCCDVFSARRDRNAHSTITPTHRRC